jgi:glutamyl-tRNA synthetase
VAWLSARSQHGRVILRIEDLDVSRVRPGAAQGAMDDLLWLGLDWDEGPFFQSQRLELYDQALGVLKSANLVYPCTCTRAEIARAASAPHAEEEGPSYPGTCSYRSAEDAEKLGSLSFAWRFRVPAGPVVWDDLFQGQIELDPSTTGGDFLVGRQRLGPSYQLAVVVDDARMGVTEVIRGLDLVPSTPRQILLYRALGREVPRFGHVGLVYGPDGRRLAKRDDSIKLSTLREQGVDPRALIGKLAQTLGLESSGSSCTPHDLVPSYSVPQVNRDGWNMDASSRIG